MVETRLIFCMDPHQRHSQQMLDVFHGNGEHFLLSSNRMIDSGRQFSACPKSSFTSLTEKQSEKGRKSFFLI